MSKRAKLTSADKAELIRMRGNECFNCRTTENIEWHHVVPLEIGGEDTMYNMVPLCRSCHKAVTHHELILATAGREYKYKNAGRKRKIPSNYEEVLERYCRCEIGKKECKKLLGISETNNITDSSWFKDYLDKRNIRKFRNSIDLRLAKYNSIKTGDHIGDVVYTDGRKETFYARHDMMPDDIEQIKFDFNTGNVQKKPNRYTGKTRRSDKPLQKTKKGQ